MTITQSTFKGPENNEYLAEVSAQETDEVKARSMYSLTYGNEVETFPIEFNPADGTMKFAPLGFALTPLLICVATCGLKHLAKEILDCWLSGHRSPTDMIKCLRGKSHSIASGLGNCAINCLP